MTEWKECTLGDVLSLKRGYDLPKSQMRDGNIPVAGSNGIIGFHDEFTPITPCITIGRSGNIGNVYYYDRCWAHNTTLYVDDYKGNNPKYLYYFLKTLPIASYAGGSAVPTLNRNHIYPIKVCFCSNVEKQKEIADILSSLDDKIEVNRKINENLEQQAEALFKSWFVDFEPFKDGKFIDSELGKIPEGWRVGTFQEIVDIKSGGTPKTTTSEYWNGDIPFFTPKDVSDSAYCFDTEKHITELGLTKCNSALYPKNTIFITARGTVGKISLAGTNMAMNQTCYALVGKTKGIQFYIFWQLFYLVERIKKKANGAVFSAITTKDFDENIVIPPMDYIVKFNNLVLPLFEKIHNLGQENICLSKLRDTLLPKLMSGEISIL